MGDEDGLAPPLENVVDGGFDTLDPGGVGHDAVLDGHVDIHAHQDALARQIHLV